MTLKEKFFEFAHENTVGELLLKQAQLLHGQSDEVTLEEIEEWVRQRQLPLKRADIIRAAREMEGLGLSHLIVGRRGAATRIKWLLDTSDLDDDSRRASSQEATGGVYPSSSTQSAIEGSGKHEFEGGVLEHSFRVRADFPITFLLPSDFSPAEAERLCAFIKSLPF